jgi:hypothetical protein
MCAEHQPQRVETKDRVGFGRCAAADRDDTAALRGRMRIFVWSQSTRGKAAMALGSSAGTALTAVLSASATARWPGVR